MFQKRDNFGWAIEDSRPTSEVSLLLDDESGSADDESGSADDESGSADDESGSADDESGSADDESGSADDESGSAVVEFVALALPLFVPALIFFMAISTTAKSEMESKMISRQAIHAFLGGDSESQAHARVSLLINEYRKLKGDFYQNLDYQIRCSEYPCLTPNGLVEVSVWSGTDHHSVARGYVDKWR
jgi:hypothetical protein